MPTCRRGPPKTTYGPDQIRLGQADQRSSATTSASALANAIDAGDAALAVQLVANHPHPIAQRRPNGRGVRRVPASRRTRLAGCRDEPGYPRVLMVAAYDAQLRGDSDACG